MKKQKSSKGISARTFQSKRRKILKKEELWRDRSRAGFRRVR